MNGARARKPTGTDNKEHLAPSTRLAGRVKIRSTRIRRRRCDEVARRPGSMSASQLFCESPCKAGRSMF
jgi:hypothetical protein